MVEKTIWLKCQFGLFVGLTALVSLNMSNSRVSNSGLHHLKPLKNLRSLTLESCKVTATELKKIQLAALPNLINVRPEWNFFTQHPIFLIIWKGDQGWFYFFNWGIWTMEGWNVGPPNFFSFIVKLLNMPVSGLLVNCA